MYFAKAKWPQDWIKTAEAILREQWEGHYKGNAGPAAAPKVYPLFLSSSITVTSYASLLTLLRFHKTSISWILTCMGWPEMLKLTR
jgi:hypothetical protein